MEANLIKSNNHNNSTCPKIECHGILYCDDGSLWGQCSGRTASIVKSHLVGQVPSHTSQRPHDHYGIVVLSCHHNRNHHHHNHNHSTQRNWKCSRHNVAIHIHTHTYNNIRCTNSWINELVNYLKLHICLIR